MISWIQITFQKHFRMVFAILLAVTIISFIMTIGATPGIGNGEGRVASKKFYNLNLASADGQQELMGDAGVSALFQIGYGLDNDQLQPFALQRYASLYIANKLHIPAPTKTELADYIKTLRVFQNQDGEFDPVAYNRFRDSLKGNSRLSEATVSRVLSDDYRVDQIRKLMAGPGYVMPSDVAEQLTRAGTTWSIDVATIDYASYKPSINPTDAEIARYFSDNAFRYQIPPRFSGYSVDFPAANYLSKVKITNADLKAFYNENPARFTPPAAKPGSKALAIGFDAVKGQVEAAFREDRARLLAQNAAADLTVFLYDNKATAAEIPALLSQRGETTHPLTPFARNEACPEFPGNVDVTTEAFRLGPDRLYSDALATKTGATVIFWEKTIPARQPLLAEVRDKVVADYIESQRHREFIDLGNRIKSALQARIAQGMAFDAAVHALAQSDGVKIEAKTIPPFTLSQPPRDLDYSIFGTLQQLNKGQVSSMTVAGGKGTIVYAAGKKLPVIATSNPMYDSIDSQLAMVAANGTAASVMNELVERQLGNTPMP